MCVMTHTHEADMQSTLTTGDVSQRVAVPAWRILAAIRRGFLDEPPRVARYRIWSEDDLPRVRAALVAAGYLADEREAAGAK